MAPRASSSAAVTASMPGGRDGEAVAGSAIDADLIPSAVRQRRAFPAALKDNLPHQVTHDEQVADEHQKVQHGEAAEEQPDLERQVEAADSGPRATGPQDWRYHSPYASTSRTTA